METQTVTQEQKARLRERTLRILARQGRAEALRSLHGYLYQYGMEKEIEQGKERARVGDLETDAGVRTFVNSIV